MRRSRGAIAAVGLGASLILIWLCAVGVPLVAATDANPRHDKFSQAERLVFFRIEPGELLRIPLPAEPEALRLVTHVVLPEGTSYAPERQWVYGIDARIVDASGAPLHRRTVFARTRQSKAQPTADGWLQESAFTPDPRVQLTDGRELMLPLPAEVRGAERVLQLRYAGETGTLLVRVYGRTPETAPLFALHQDPVRKRAVFRADQATFLPWSMLRPEDHARIVNVNWERLSADGELDVDYRTLAIYRTPFRLPLIEVEESAKERLGGNRAVAINVRGPAEPTLWVWSTSGPETRHGPLVVTSLDQEGRERRWELPGPLAGQASAHALELAEGLQTLSIHNRGASELHYTLESSAASALVPPDREHPRETGALGLLPDLRRAEAYVSGPGCAALEVELGDDPGERLVRLDARALLLGGGELEPTRVAVELHDARGTRLSELHLEVGHELEVYEAAALGAPNLPCVTREGSAPPMEPLEVTDWPALVSRSSSGRLFIPVGARTLRIRAERPVVVQLFRFHLDPEGARSLPPYDGAFEKVRWRHPPMAERHWHPMRPKNHRELSTEGARVQVSTQVRLERVGEREASEPVGVPLSIVPLSPPRSEELLEPIAPWETAGRIVYSRLEPGKALRVRFESSTPRRAELRLLAGSTDALGQPLEVWVDGKRLHQSLLRSTHARLLLAPLEAGDHELELRTAAPGLVAAINRAPIGGRARAYVERTVYRLGQSGLRIPVYKQDAGPVTLNLVLYTASSARDDTPALRVTVDGGQPKRRTGAFLSRLTRSRRELVLPESLKGAVAPLGGSERWFPRSLHVTLGDDLGPGLHVVHVQPIGQEPMWARFFVYAGGRSAEPVRQWNRLGWEEEETP